MNETKGREPLHDPTLDRYELEYRLVYSPIVAGKSAWFAESATRRFLDLRAGYTPLAAVRAMIASGDLGACLRTARTGSYGRLERWFRELVNLDPATCTVHDLEAVHGIGSKTARFFILWTRPDARVAALDTHVLKWLRAKGYDAPKASPPPGERYDRLERSFIAEADAVGMTPRELDYAVWSAYSGYVEPESAEQLALESAS